MPTGRKVVHEKGLNTLSNGSIKGNECYKEIITNGQKKNLVQKKIDNHSFKESLSKCVMQTRGTNPFLAWNKSVPDANTLRFKEYIEDKYRLHFDSYWDLHSWTLDNTESFWAEVWNYFDIISSKTYDKAFVQTGPGFLENEWFTGAKFNYAENILRIRNNTIAISYLDEVGYCEDITFAQLYEEVRRYSAAFRKTGMRRGDMVCCHMPNRKEVVIALLACASIGAVWSAIQPFYGAKASAKIAERTEPKFLFTLDEFQRENQITDVLEKIPTILENVTTVNKVIIVATQEKTKSLDLSNIKNSCFLHNILEDARLSDGSYPELEFEQVPFNHPMFLNFTSGTTGLPKGPVHGAGNFIPLLLDISLHWNLKAGDTIFSQFPPGWAVYNWFIPCLSQGVRLCLYNGSPFHVREGLNFWHLVDQNRGTWMFIEPGVLDQMEKTNNIPDPQTKLESLKMISVCGSPVKVQNVKFALTKIKKDVFVGSLYGSTESYGFYSGFDMNLPLYGGEIQVPALGKDMKCFNSSGQPVEGELGELVLIGRSPSYPLYLWKDSDRSVIHKNYLESFPGKWSPSDEAWINPSTKGIIIVGRSDDVLIQHGECFGSADVYFAIHDMEEIKDYVCVSQTRLDGDVRAVLFVKLREGYSFTQGMRRKIAKKVEDELWEEYVPDVILNVPDIPYNVNGKRMEGTVRKIVATNQIPQVMSIRNPECLKHFANRPEVLTYFNQS